MFYRRLGELTARYRYLIVFAWVAAAVVIMLTAPPLNDVLTSEMERFLPEQAPYKHAHNVYVETFPDENAAASIVVVFDAGEAGILDLTQEDFAGRIDTPAGRLLADFAAWLRGPDRPENVINVNSPTDGAEVAGMTVGPDNQVAIVNISLASNNAADQTSSVLDAWLDEHNPGNIETYQTGLFAIGQSTSEVAIETVDRTIWVTVVLVVFLLLLIYRSPISPLVPLLAVTLVYFIVSGLVAFVAASGVVVISTYASVMLVVILYGAGTDYCLFLISRFREEMADTTDVAAAVTRTVERVGETIASSAGTVFVGFMALAFAEMGLFRTSGPALAIGILVMLLAGLTLAPALLAILGDRAFWPGKAKHRSTGRYYEQVSKLVSSRPIVTIILITAIMAPFAIHGLTAPSSYDLMADLPDDAEPLVGFRRIESSLGAGNMSPLTVIVTGREPGTLAADIMTLSAELRALPGVADVRSLNDPLGNNGPMGDLLLVSGQLRLIGGMMGGGMAAAGGANLPQLADGVAALNSYLSLLAERFPEVADDPNLETLQTLFSNPLQLVLRQGDIAPALDGLAARFDTLDDAYLLPTELEPLLAAAPSEGGYAEQFETLTTMYMANEGTAFRLTVILTESPDSFAAMDTVKAIRDVLEAYSGPGDAVVYGQTVITTDIRDTIERDLYRAIGFVVLGIFIVLLIMLRSIVAPIYLIATVALSFAFTLGLTDVLFRAVAGVQGLTWYMPFFTFVFLVALGVDYSIFLIGRVKEEVSQHDMREGVHRAVAATGAIITSAGVILAGTFAALMTGSIMGLVELGFAVAVGILVDTFIVRTMLVPSLTVLLGRWAWWPGHVPGERSQVAVKPVTSKQSAG